MKNYKGVFDLIIIGNGISAYNLLYKISQTESLRSLKIGMVHSDKLAPGCSSSIPSIVSQHGTRKGINRLGDTLYDAFFLTKDLVNKCQPEGVEKVCHISLLPDDIKGRDNFFRRYKTSQNLAFNFWGQEYKREGIIASGYIFHFKNYLNWLEKEVFINLNLTKLEGFVQKFEILEKNVINKIELSLLDGKTLFAASVIFCTGAYTKIFENTFDNFGAKIGRTQYAPGSIIRFKCRKNFKHDSVIVSTRGTNLYYSGLRGELFFGSTKARNNAFCNDYLSIKQSYEKFIEDINFDFQAPDISDGEIVTGVRHKGIQRRPFWGPLLENKNVFIGGIFGLYKSGYSFSHLAAKDIVDKNLTSFFKYRNKLD